MNQLEPNGDHNSDVIGEGTLFISLTGMALCTTAESAYNNGKGIAVSVTFTPLLPRPAVVRFIPARSKER